jgi:hypothetical protein
LTTKYSANEENAAFVDVEFESGLSSENYSPDSGEDVDHESEDRLQHEVEKDEMVKKGGGKKGKTVQKGMKGGSGGSKTHDSVKSVDLFGSVGLLLLTPQARSRDSVVTGRTSRQLERQIENFKRDLSF